MNSEDQNKKDYSEDGDENITNQNIRLLFSALNTEKLAPEEKQELWDRINNDTSIEEVDTDRKSIKLLWGYGIAASITLLLVAGLGFYLLRKDNNSMKELAQKVSIQTTDTELQLADARTILLKGENSNIEYQKGSIRLDSATVSNNKAESQKYSLNTLVVPYGKRSFIRLLDGTQIWLNSGSKLVYPSEFTPGKREVYIEGQAYFSVAHDSESPFYVQTDHMNIKVLGTEFDISSYPDDHSAAAVLSSGSIELSTDIHSIWGSKKSKMIPGTRAIYSNETNTTTTQKVSVDQYTSWKEGYLILKKEPLDQILKKLSRYYKYELIIKNPEVGKETFSGTLDLQDNIDNVIDMIANTTSLTYHKSERRFVLEKITETK